MESISGMNCGESPYWPGVVSLVIGRQRRSATRWILVVQPPRDFPSASRPDFLSFEMSPCAGIEGIVGGRYLAGPGGVLMGTVDG